MRVGERQHFTLAEILTHERGFTALELSDKHRARGYQAAREDTKLSWRDIDDLARPLIALGVRKSALDLSDLSEEHVRPIVVRTMPARPLDLLGPSSCSGGQLFSAGNAEAEPSTDEQGTDHLGQPVSRCATTLRPLRSPLPRDDLAPRPPRRRGLDRTAA